MNKNPDRQSKGMRNSANVQNVNNWNGRVKPVFHPIRSW